MSLIVVRTPRVSSAHVLLMENTEQEFSDDLGSLLMEQQELESPMTVLRWMETYYLVVPPDCVATLRAELMLLRPRIPGGRKDSAERVQSRKHELEQLIAFVSRALELDEYVMLSAAEWPDEYEIVDPEEND